MPPSPPSHRGAVCEHFEASKPNLTEDQRILYYNVIIDMASSVSVTPPGDFIVKALSLDMDSFAALLALLYKV